MRNITFFIFNPVNIKALIFSVHDLMITSGLLDVMLRIKIGAMKIGEINKLEGFIRTKV